MFLKFKNYQITFDPLGNEDEISDSLEQEMIDLYYEVSNANKRTVRKILNLITQYPENVQLRNYLVNAYRSLGKNKEAMQANKELLEMRPDYLFGLLLYTDLVMEDGFKVEKMPKIFLDAHFDLKEMYPNREVFHISEFVAMQQVAIKYYAYNDEGPKALERLEWLKEINPDEETNEQMQKIYTSIMLIKASERLMKEQKARIKPVSQRKQTPFERPTFQLPLTEELYKNGWLLSQEFIEEYLQSDKKLLTKDLELVLKDSYSNFEIEQEGQEAAFHAYFMLGEIGAKESLPSLLEVLSQDEEYIEYVFGDFLTETCWQTIFQLAKDKIPELFAFMKQPGLYTFGKGVALDTLTQLYIAYPDTQEQIIEGYKELLDLFCNAKIEDNVIDTTFIGLFIGDLVELNLSHFLPQIKCLYDEGYLLDYFSGNYDKIEEILCKNNEIEVRKRKIESLVEIYQGIRNYHEEIKRSEEIINRNKTFIAQSKKVGRNDPCPCGSGKKYKKCCLGKGIYE